MTTSSKTNKSRKDKKEKMICKECGKEMPIDKDKSTPNWKVYKEKCICGGKGDFSL